MHLYGENVEKLFSQNVLKMHGLNLQCMIIEVKLFSYKSKFCPLGLSSLAPGLKLLGHFSSRTQDLPNLFK